MGREVGGNDVKIGEADPLECHSTPVQWKSARFRCHPLLLKRHSFESGGTQYFITRCWISKVQSE